MLHDVICALLALGAVPHQALKYESQTTRRIMYRLYGGCGFGLLFVLLSVKDNAVCVIGN